MFAVLAGRSRTRRSNREIARILGISEATVRRGLKRFEAERREQKRAADRAALLTEKGRARARRFRTREYLTRMRQRRENA